ncbi:MAG: hypothetical protein HY717_01775, partial [Planctomycetes bacterium]|nr:hypothetical protein [Planctomycetota bacterium]
MFHCRFLVVIGVISFQTGLASEAGKDWGSERQAYEDPVTGVRVWE